MEAETDILVEHRAPSLLGFAQRRGELDFEGDFVVLGVHQAPTIKNS